MSIKLMFLSTPGRRETVEYFGSGANLECCQNIYKNTNVVPNV
ncbi:hypothetical protein [Ectobacillus panaciterrae]|nr:hypothetical protein [Ectobacillus panaciterrae]